MDLRTACLAVFLTSIALVASAADIDPPTHDALLDASVADSPAVEAVGAKSPVADSPTEPSPGFAALFAGPAFTTPATACGDPEAPTPPAATGLMGCPIGPTCFSDAQCAFACPVGTGVCAPNFCCWCIVG